MASKTDAGTGRRRSPNDDRLAGPKSIHSHLNTLGQLCPEPIINTAKIVKKMKEGQILEIISDDWGMLTDLPAWCKSTGHKLVEINDEGRFLRCFIQMKNLGDS